MVLFNDIYYLVDSKIVEKGYWQLSIEEQKALVTAELKLYLINKLRDVSWEQYLLVETNVEKMDIGEIVSIISKCIDKEKHVDTISHFVHYILKIAGSMQDRSITWWVETEDEFVETPVIEFNDNNFWDTLKTHKETDYTKIFNFVYDVFNNKFLVEKSFKRLRIKADI